MKLELDANSVKTQISCLKLYRSGWANDIREGWDFSNFGAQEILFELYEISGSIILALQDVATGSYRDKMAMILTKKKLEKLVKSKSFDEFACLSELGVCNIISTGAKHHIRAMFECLEVLTK